MADALEWLAADLDVGSVEWWLRRLGKELFDRRDDLDLYDDYYSGEHPLVFTGEAFRKAFGDLFDDFADNWCDLVVDAVEERLNPEGFRFGGRGRKADDAAWKIWQRNTLDAGSQIAHTEALINGESSVLVWDDDTTSDDEALITVEHPNQMIVASSPGRYLERKAALKVWMDEDDFELATLYLPDGIYKFRSRTRTTSTWPLVGSRWERRETNTEPWPLPNTHGVVPVVPLYNRPRLLKKKGRISRGVSEIKGVVPLQDAVNKFLADMLVASEFGSFRQRWATGISVPKDPETGKPIEEFKAAVDHVWATKSKDAKFGEFEQTDLEKFVKAIEMVVQHIASQTRTPPHYFALTGQFPSGESIKSAETGLVAKARRKMRHFGEAWEEVMRLAFLIEGDAKRGKFMEAETVWGDPEYRSEAEHIDALVKQKAIGVPDEMLWEQAGYSPQTIKRMKEMKAAEPPAPAPPAPPPAPQPAE
jgi:hypothetical protein